MVWVVLQECKYSCKKFMSIAYLRGCPPPSYQDKKTSEKNIKTDVLLQDTTPIPDANLRDQFKPKKEKRGENGKSPSIYKSSPTLAKSKLGKKYKF